MLTENAHNILGFYYAYFLILLYISLRLGSITVFGDWPHFILKCNNISLNEYRQ